ncbi:ArnT family glycosyltransferase [Coralloluteibacterium stylophorae]|uniref:Glycosyltransferase family 39 protein n=1 Tax=Coralloluteibacterium stylophorae TaxID=1776034 RepID=A0A8J7VRX6_9GAMM|nr:glycosyltransferase family 39 protein [Coralloluteibacterium stylophorae]MBS7457078.1 glycosyltransferase family 39 protein [Coralloluteibacterium stylophorae]
MHSVVRYWSYPRLVLLLLLLALAALGAGLGLRDPSPPDEPRFALAARQMVESGSWLVPHRGNEIYPDKPPMFMWTIAAGYALTGDLRVAFLLPSLLAALGTLWLTVDLARRLWNPRVAVWAGFALLGCLQFGLQAKRAQIDMLLVFMTTLSLWGLLRHLLRGPDWPAFCLGAFAAGLGTVTKGVGFLPLLALLPWAATRRFAPRATTTAAGGWCWAGFALAFVAGAGVWLVPMLVAVATSSDPAMQAYADNILFKQTGERYANAWHHVQPAWYYLEVIFTLWLPGALLLPWLLPAWWRRLKRRDARLVVLLGWSLLTLLFFTASPGKREVYIFPVLPALCVAAAPLLPGLLRRRGVHWILAAFIVLLSLLFAAAGASGLADARWAVEKATERGMSLDSMHRLMAWLLGLGVAGLVLLATLRLRRIGAAVVSFIALLWTVYGVGLAPAVDASSSARRLMREAGAHIGPDAELALIGWREQHLLQADRPTRTFGFRRDWQDQWTDATPWLAQAPQRRWLFVLDEALSPCADATQVVAIGESNRRRWLLVPGTAMRQGCVTPALADEIDDEEGAEDE